MELETAKFEPAMPYNHEQFADYFADEIKYATTDDLTVTSTPAKRDGVGHQKDVRLVSILRQEARDTNRIEVTLGCNTLQCLRSCGVDFLISFIIFVTTKL